MRNRYFVRSHILEVKFREIVRYFSVDLTALQAAEFSGLNRNTINRIHRGLGERIAETCEDLRPMFGVVEVDESLFGAKRVKGKRGRGGLHINGIEGFWGFAKVRLAKFKGIPDATFHLHLKETEWRFNHRHSDKHKTLLIYLRNRPLN